MVAFTLNAISISTWVIKRMIRYTSLDLASGYWQVPLTNSANSEISAIATTAGLYQFKRHYEVFKQVLLVFQLANLKIKPLKCRVLETRVDPRPRGGQWRH
ncbi:hypothetical protein Aduo_008411 [Ancylostoma duodenale]